VTPANRDAVLKVLQHIESASDGLALIPESFKREEAYGLIEDAHQAVARLLLGR
jgi:hypothetical protein